MSLLNEELSLWEIAFRWTDRDPDKLRIRIPLPVRDNFRMMMDAVLQGHLPSETLFLEKQRQFPEFPAEFFIRTHLDDVYACINGTAYKRKLLRWVRIERWAMQQWCEGHGIPLPEFWFPPGWKYEYQRPYPEAGGYAENGESPRVNGSAQPEHVAEQPPPHAKPQQVLAQPEQPTGSEAEAEGRRKLDRRQRARIACQEVAVRLWRDQSTADVKTIANTREIQALAGGDEFEFEVVRRWIAEVDPRDPGNRRGPKRKK